MPDDLCLVLTTAALMWPVAEVSHERTWAGSASCITAYTTREHLEIRIDCVKRLSELHLCLPVSFLLGCQLSLSRLDGADGLLHAAGRGERDVGNRHRYATTTHLHLRQHLSWTFFVSRFLPLFKTQMMHTDAQPMKCGSVHGSNLELCINRCVVSTSASVRVDKVDCVRLVTFD